MADLQVGGSAPSDTDRSDIRAGLGLGDSATRAVGTTAGTVAAGDDSRLSNSRTPTAHAASHAAGEADAITPASIGALEVTGTPTTGQLLRFDGAAWVPATISSGAYEVADWPALLALTGVPNGRVYTVRAPVITGGTVGTRWARDSGSLSGWRPAGSQQVYSAPAQVNGITGGTTAAQKLGEALVPAGLLPGALQVDVFALWVNANLGSDSASRAFRLRLGATGTESDPLLIEYSSQPVSDMATSAPWFGEPTSATVLRGDQRTAHNGVLPMSPYFRSSSSVGSDVLTTSTTVPDMTTTAMHLTAWVQQAGTVAATMALRRFVLTLR